MNEFLESNRGLRDEWTDVHETSDFYQWEHATPVVTDVEGSYADLSADVNSEKEYSWQHGLGEIATALIDAGPVIELLHEYPFSEWDMGFTVEGPDGTWVMPDSVQGEVPLFYSLRARKPA